MVNFVAENKSNFVIIPEDKNQTAVYAAKELKKYVFLSTGAILWIKGDTSLNQYRFYIGKKYFEKCSDVDIDLNGDGFILKICKNEIYLTAKTDRGLIFGVYRFLEKYLGIRFFNYDCEKIPETDNLILQETTHIEKPTFAMRSYLITATWQGHKKNVENWKVEFSLKLKQCNEHIRNVKPKYGGRCPMFGRGGTHNMHNYVPLDKYKDSNPEFYYFNKELGYYTIDLLSGITDDGKLDESMEVSVAKIVIEELKKEIINNPDIEYFQFEQEDGDTTIYPYEKGSKKGQLLEKYGRSGILIRFCNLIARTLQEWANNELNGRKINIVTFVYEYTKAAPVKIVDNKLLPIDNSVICADNLILRMAIGADFSCPYFDKSQEENNRIVNEWKTVCNKFMFWGYDSDGVSQIWYHPTIKNIEENIRGVKDVGVIYAMFESALSKVPDNKWQAAIKAYIYSNKMWNINYSVNELYNEYMDNYYGVASKWIKKIVAILENYSLYVKSIYSGYQVGTFLWSYRHADLQSYKLLNRLLDIYDVAEKEIKESDISNKQTLFVRINNIKATLLHMKVNKANWDFYRSAEICGIKQFSGLSRLPKNAGQRLHNVEMVWRVKEKLIIPDDVKEQINSLDPMAISDTIDFDTVY